MRTYRGTIDKLQPNQIFVFGSNTEGRHGKGAAKWAHDNAGAIYGRATGRQGNSYAIVTKDLHCKVHPSVSVQEIIQQIKKLYEYTRFHKGLEFVVAYSGTNPNLNGYSPKEMAEMFSCEEIPGNMVFEEEFYKLICNILLSTTL